jgi:hypothetical protein
MPPTVATVPTMSILFAGGLMDSDRPTFQVTDPSFPLHDLASKLSEAGRLGRHDSGMQNVNPEARTCRQEESTGPTPEIGHGVKATGTGDGTERVQAMQSAGSRARNRRS